MSYRTVTSLCTNLSLDKDELFEQVKESTERNRNFFYIWIGFAFYVIVTTTSTTDLQLLLPDSNVILPTIGVQLPLIGYFIITPWLVMMLHFNLLQNLDTHAHKLQQWASCYPEEDPPRALLQAFIFDYSMLERDATFDVFTRSAAKLLCYALGPITIGIMLWRFSDYQNVLYTLSQFAAFVCSAALVIKARKALPKPPILNKESKPSKFRKILILVGSKLDISQSAFHGIGSKFHWLINILFMWVRISASFLHILLDGLGGIFGLVLTIIVLFETFCVMQLDTRQDSWLPNADRYRIFEPFVPRLTIPPNTSIINLNGNLKLSMELDGETIFKSWWEKYGKGADLNDRNLRLADMSGIDMRKVQLKHAHLQGAYLRGAHLQGADFREALLQGANLSDTQLQGADLSHAQLQGAYFNSAQMQGAYFNSAQMQGAYFNSAQMQGAYLGYALLQGAKLRAADLRGVDLSDAQLQGTDLSEAQLQGVNLRDADLSGANLSEAKLQGADLNDARLQGSLVSITEINQEPRYIGKPLVLGWKVSADDSDWTSVLSNQFIPEFQRHKLITAWNKARRQPIPLLQIRLHSTRTIENNYEIVARDTAPALCYAGVASVKGGLGSWLFYERYQYKYFEVPPASRVATILANALLEEVTCLPHHDKVCETVGDEKLPINNRSLCKNKT